MNLPISRMLNKSKLLEELHEIARKYGGYCLSNEYINSKEKLLFECKHGHQFESCRNYLKAGNWCPFCTGRGKTIADLQELASQQGGRCLSPTYLGMEKKHLWECARVTHGKQYLEILRRSVDGVLFVGVQKVTEIDDDILSKI